MLFYWTSSLNAQLLVIPRTSPIESVTQYVGVCQVTVDYHGPSVRDRQIYWEKDRVITSYYFVIEPLTSQNHDQCRSAEDIIQDAFLKAHKKKISTFRGDATHKT